MQSLLNTLTQAGKPSVQVAFAEGSQLLVLPTSGRVVGLYPAAKEGNFLWTHSALASRATASACFAPGGWSNPGGDRTWLAPEIELFISDPTRPFETYSVPAALDPGRWILVSSSVAEVRLTNSTALQLQRAKRTVELRMDKQYCTAANPLRDTALAGRVQYAGYTQITTLELTPAAEPAIRLGIWNLLQLPQPGVMLIPTRITAPPQHVFGTISSAELAVESRVVRWTMEGPGPDAKIALKADALTGRAGYVRQTPIPGIWDLVVREFVVDPCGDYVDELWQHPHEAGWAFQACCVRSGVERFNELEYHAPAAVSVAGSNRRRDESSLWAFRGSDDAITAAARLLLDVDLHKRKESIKSHE